MVGPLCNAGSEGIVELPHPTFVALTGTEPHGSHPPRHRIKSLLIRKNVFVRTYGGGIELAWITPEAVDGH